MPKDSSTNDQRTRNRTTNLAIGKQLFYTSHGMNQFEGDCIIFPFKTHLLCVALQPGNKIVLHIFLKRYYLFVVIIRPN